ncbi:MAG: hypothetical protein NTW32_21485 [Chloroflexi bacterium]|nr:hypothetical protein [Chloroflexota bacterium]
MADFEKIIQDFAEHLEWEIDWNSENASVDFEIEPGEVQTVFITNNGETVEFDVFSKYYFESEEDIPHPVSTQLLMRNTDLEVGAWVLEKLDDGWHFSVMYNEDLDTLDSMDYDELDVNLKIILAEASSLALQ